MKKNFRILTNGPFTYLGPSVTHTSITILLILIPQIFMLFYTKSFTNLIIIGLSVLASLLAEITSNKIRNVNSLLDFTFLVQGLCIGMLIPSTFPLIPIPFMVYFSLLVSKYIFGGIGNSWINPMCYTIVFFFLIGSNYFPASLLTKECIATGQPGIDLIQNGSIPVLDLDASLTFWLNTNIFGKVGIEIPTGYLSLFWDSGSVIPAFRFNILTLFASIILFSFDMLNWIIPTVYLVVYGTLVVLFSQTAFTGVIGRGDLLLSFLTSGTLFTAFFLMNAYGSNPVSVTGKFIYGLLAGIIAFALCGCGTSSVGNIFTVLICNICSPLIQVIEDQIYAIKMNKLVRKNNYV